MNGPKWKLRAQMLRERATGEPKIEVRAHLLAQALQLERKARAVEHPPWWRPPPGARTPAADHRARTRG